MSSVSHRPQRLLVMPDDGVAPVVGLIDAAGEQLLLKQFELQSPVVEQALGRALARGVQVRVMLNPRTSAGDRRNDETFARLQSWGIETAWTSEAFPVTHETSMVVDRHTALVASFDLTDRFFTELRGYGVLSGNPAVVDQVIAGFEADWQRTFFQPDPGVGLLWSVAHSRGPMARIIDGACRTLWIQHPRFVDAVILERIISARDRGVKVRVLCGGRQGLRDWDIHDTFSSLRLMQRFGVKLRRQQQPRLHAKLILVDGACALTGSLNIDRSAFDLQRELAIVSDEPEVLARLRETFEADWGAAAKYRAPDPLDPSLHGAEAGPPESHPASHDLQE